MYISMSSAQQNGVYLPIQSKNASLLNFVPGEYRVATRGCVADRVGTVPGHPRTMSGSGTDAQFR